MSQIYFWPPSGGAGSNASVGGTGVAAPSSATEVAGVDGGGVLRALSVDTSGKLNVNAGGAADSTQTGTITSTQSVTINTAGYATVGMQSTGTWTGTLVVEGSVDNGTTYQSTTITEITSGIIATQFTSNIGGSIQCSGFSQIRIRGNTIASGTATIYLRANSTTALVMLDNPLPGGTNQIGTVGLVAGSAIVGKVGIDQTTVGTTNAISLAQIGATTVASGNGVAGAGVQRVTIASDNTAFSVNATLQTGANNIGNVGLLAGSNNVGSITNVTGTVSLPTGAATSALQTTISGQLPASLGQKTMANSMAVVLASDQSTINTAQGGSAGPSNAPVRNVYSSTNVTTGAYVQLVASTTNATNAVEIFDSSGQTLAFAVGPGGSEVIQFYIFPGGNGRVPLAIPAASRIAVKAISANAVSGELDINFYK